MRTQLVAMSGIIAAVAMLIPQASLRLKFVAFCARDLIVSVDSIEFVVSLAQAEPNTVSPSGSPSKGRAEYLDEATATHLVAAQLANYVQGERKATNPTPGAAPPNIEELAQQNRVLETQQQELIARLRDYREQLRIQTQNAEQQKKASVASVTFQEEQRTKIERETEQRVAREWSDKLNSALAEQKIEHERLTSKLASAKAQIQELEQKLALRESAQSATTTLQNELEKLRATLAQERAKSEAESQTISRQNKNIDLAINKIQSLQEEKKILEEKLSDLEKQTDGQALAREQFLGIIDSCLKILAQRAEESKQLRAGLRAAFERIATLDEQLTHRASNREELHALDDSQQVPSDKKDEEIEKLKQALDRASNKITSLQKLVGRIIEEKTQIEKSLESKNGPHGY